LAEMRQKLRPHSVPPLNVPFQSAAVNEDNKLAFLPLWLAQELKINTAADSACMAVAKAHAFHFTVEHADKPVAAQQRLLSDYIGVWKQRIYDARHMAVEVMAHYDHEAIDIVLAALLGREYFDKTTDKSWTGRALSAHTKSGVVTRRPFDKLIGWWHVTDATTHALAIVHHTREFHDLAGSLPAHPGRPVFEATMAPYWAGIVNPDLIDGMGYSKPARTFKEGFCLLNGYYETVFGQPPRMPDGYTPPPVPRPR